MPEQSSSRMCRWVRGEVGWEVGPSPLSPLHCPWLPPPSHAASVHGGLGVSTSEQRGPGHLGGFQSLAWRCQVFMPRPCGHLVHC